MILGLLSLVSCTEYDEVAMWNKNEDMGSRLAALEELCSRLNTNIVSLQQIVEALQGNDYVTGVVPVVENGETVGYTISFSKSGPVTIYHGKKGENGQNGTTPVIGVEQDTDGLYYWTLDGEWLENISIHHFFLYLPCTFPQKAQGWARICALYMEKTFTSVWLSGFRTSHLLTCRKNRWQPVTSSWYVYLRTVPSFRGKDMPYTYRRGLSALLVLDRWACEGLGTRNGQR